MVKIGPFIGLAVFAVALTPAHAQEASADLSAKVLACRELDRDKDRLKCFDAAMVSVFGENVQLEARRLGDIVTIRATPVAETGPMTVQLVRFMPKQSVEITRGENRGKTVSYAHITHGWTELGKWDGSAPFELNADAAGDDPVVVIVQGAGYGPILAAIELR